MVNYSWTGFHYDGKTAHREPVTISVAGGGLHVVRADGGSFLWSFGELHRADRVGHESLRIEHRAERIETLSINEPGLLDSVRVVSPATAKRLTSWSGRFDASARDTALKLAAATLVVAGLYFLALPALASVIAARIPVSWEENLGRSVLETAAPVMDRCQSPTTQAALDQIVARLLQPATPTPYHFTVTLVDDSVVNAFAAPGGFIVVNRGLLEATQTAEEMAGVLAHEIQHVVRHHVTRGIVREIPTRIVVGSIAGGADAIGAAATRAAGVLGAMRFRREDEVEADREGMRMLQAARVDSHGMLSFFRMLATRQGAQPRLAGYLSTHPQTTERLSVLGRLANLSAVQPEPLELGRPWPELKAGCEQVTH